MIRKTILLFVFMCFAVIANAQVSSGDWLIHPVYCMEMTKVVNTPKSVYFLVDQNLFVYSKADGAISHMSKRVELNANLVSNIFYNAGSGYLMVVYSSSNIDVIYADGTIVNVPDIADVQLTMSRAINDITFAGSKAYIATDFGYLEYDGDKRHIAKACNYYTAIKSVLEVGDNIWLSTDSQLYYGNKSARHPGLSSFTASSIAKGGNLTAVSATSFLLNSGGVSRIDIAAGDVLTTTAVTPRSTSSVQAYGNGFVARVDRSSAKATDAYIAIIDAQGALKTTIALPENTQTSLFCEAGDDDTLWELGASGLRSISISGAAITALGDYKLPSASNVKIVANLVYNTPQNTLYVMTCGINALNEEYEDLGYVNTLQNGVWSNISPVNVPDNRKKGVLYNIESPVFDPEDSNSMYFGSWYEGAYKMTGGEIVNHYDWNNSPLTHAINWYCNVIGVQFDAAKNLWLVQSRSDANPMITVLPREKQPETTLTSADWINPTITVPGVMNFRAKFYITKKSDIKILTNGEYGSFLEFIDDGGNPASTSIRQKSYTSCIDQDGNAVEWNYIYCFVEDSDGRVWMGTSNGVVVLDPAKAFDSDFRVMRIKVLGSNGDTFDYLLEGEDVTCIGIDPSGRKWLGTLSTGVYSTSADGTTILSHFNSDNSYLPSDKIFAICCDPANGSVYIGTANCLAEYKSGTIAAESDYSHVTVYPVLVKPDYTGCVMISRLMDSSTVTIFDAAGSKVAMVQSAGGTASWNTCDSRGERVKTGTYAIFASQDSQSVGSKVASVNIVR